MTDTFKVEFSPKYKIPHTLQSRVCMCEDPTAGKGPFTYINYCGTCHKPMRYNIRRCLGPGGCGKVFIKDFINDNMCVRPSCQLCWDCFQKVGNTCPMRDTDEHGRYHSNGRGEQYTPLVLGPAGLNPREFTKEELDSFDIFADF